MFNREQYNFDGTLSNPEKITHGVPQGSILGPLLFIILINDIETQINKCSLMMYADDTVLYYSSNNINDMENVMNTEAGKVSLWIKENCLLLNLKKGKTEFIVYGSRTPKTKCNILIDNTPVHQPSSYEYLGVVLDSHLTLSDHYSKTSKKIATRINLLRRIRNDISPYL